MEIIKWAQLLLATLTIHVSVTQVGSVYIVENMKELYMPYENSAEYPTTMYFVASDGQGLIATDLPDGGAKFYFFALTNVLKSDTASLTRFGGSDTAGYNAGAKISTYTHIASIDLKAPLVIIAENSCIRFYNYGASGETVATRIGSCTVAGFQTDPVLLQDIIKVELTASNVLFVLCGTDGPGSGGLMSIDLDNGNSAKILLLYNDIALSAAFPQGTATVKDMTMDSTDSTMYILVNNGGIVAYNISAVPSGGVINDPLYRVTSLDGDSGANYTHDGLIYDNATIILSSDDNYLLVQNYGNSNESRNSLVSLDLSIIGNLDNGPIPTVAYSYLCAGGAESVPKVDDSSQTCVVKADFRRPVMDLDGDGNLIMLITNAQSTSYYLYTLSEWITTTTTATTTTTITTTPTPATTTPTPATTTTTTTPTTTATTTTAAPYTTTATGTSASTAAAGNGDVTTVETAEPHSTSLTTGNTSAAAATASSIAASTSASKEGVDTPSTNVSVSVVVPSISTPALTATTTSRTNIITSDAQTAIQASTQSTSATTSTTTKRAPLGCYACATVETCIDYVESGKEVAVQSCSGACYSMSWSTDSKLSRYIKGCLDDIGMRCDDDLKAGSCKDVIFGDSKTEMCTKCCSGDRCNDWTDHPNHDPSSKAMKTSPVLTLYLASLVAVLLY